MTKQLSKPKRGYKLIRSFFGEYEEIPEQWEVTAHGKICEFVNGYAYSQSEFKAHGYPIIRIQNLTGGEDFVYSDVELPEKQFAENGDLLFAWSATFGPFIWKGPKAAFHYHQWKVIPRLGVDKRFLYYHFARIAPLVKQIGQSGLGMFHMTKSGMEKLLFFRPPLEEQQKIASVLSKVDDLIQKTDEIKGQTQRLQKALTQKLLTKGIGHTKFKQTDIGNIPEEWEVASLKQVCTKITDGVHKTPTYQEKGIPFISVNNMTKGKLDFSNCKYISYQEYQELIKACFPQKGDVLLSKVGTLGVAHIVDVDFNFSIFVQVALLKPDRARIIPQYLKYTLTSAILQKAIQKNSSGTTLKYIALKKINNLKIPLPTLQEQQKIASILIKINQLLERIDQLIQQTQILKKGLMQKLLTGKIRVKV